MVMIPAFQAGGPGSIPGRRTFCRTPPSTQHETGLSMIARGADLGWGGLLIFPSAVSLMVMIPAFQAGGPGSIPGRRTDFDHLRGRPPRLWLDERYRKPT